MHRALVLTAAVLCVLGVAEAKVCPSIDVRNSPSALNKLRNCTIIMGHLQVVLIDTVIDASVYEKYTFPELIEIDEYLMIYSVTQLTSLGTLFPNLRIIRGVKLFFDFALIVWQVDDLKEIGLKNLRQIDRGAVIVDKCPNVCFVDTIDWQSLGATNLNYTNTNMELCKDQFCRRECEGHCWNTLYCQKTIIEDHCHPQCVGCTKGNSSSHCQACKYFELNGTCFQNCPQNTVINNYSMKCLTKEECGTMFNHTWFVFNNTCVQECPRYYNKRANSCEYAGDNYTKICHGPFIIDNIELLENLTTCTHLIGTVELNIQLHKKLEKHLGGIVSISGYLKIGRCHTITSLDFFRKLREIKGEELYSKEYALFIVENRNLQHLWNFRGGNSSLTITKGSVFFQNNEELCLGEIEKFVNSTNLKGKVNLKLFQNTNGATSKCNDLVSFNITIVEQNPKSVKLKWQPPSNIANETIIGHYVYYILGRPGYIPLLDNENSCGESEWTSVFERDNNVTLKDLTPYQEYFFYIKTYTTSNSRGYRSSLTLFNTTSGDPTEPLDVMTEPISDSSITLMWKRPHEANGNLSYYNIAVYKEKYYMPKRNYCYHPHTTEIEEPVETIADSVLKPAACDCAEKKETLHLFKDEMICFDPSDKQCKSHMYEIYNPNGTLMDGTRTTTEIMDRPKQSISKRAMEKKPYKEFITDGGSGNNKTYNFTDLSHFTLYIFYIRACNFKEKNESDHCGPPEMVSGRTLKRENADFVEDLNVRVDGNNALVQWRQPQETNSFLLTYQIEYKRTDLENAKSISDCIAKEDYNVKGHELHLSPGKYKIRVQAVSLAGPGKFSPWQIFEIGGANSVMYWVWGFISIFIILVFVFLALLARHRYRKRFALDNNHLFTSINPDYAGPAYEEDEWEMERSDIEFVKELGQGSFGMVYQGIIKSKNYSCAVKTVTDSASMPSRLEFLNEGAVMKSFNDAHHVIKLLGIVSRGQPPLVVMELMERGDLKSYLRRCRRPSQNLTTNELYRMAAEIADGMAYLSAKKFVHRDLAARNCMVAADNTVKIGDFGMARDVYETDYYRKETVGLLPVRWMAPESLADGVFTSDGDVWSYGIVLWEMATLAEQPYQGLSNEQVFRFVSKDRGKLERPPECSDLMYEVMEACWHWRPNSRPTFSDIVSRLVDHVGADFRLVAFCYSKQGRDLALNAGPRPYNPPAMTTAPVEDEYFGHYDPTDEEVSLCVRDSSRPSRFLPFSNQRFNNPSSYQVSPRSPSSAYSLSSS